MSKKPLVLCILDGWGLSDKAEHNAVALGKTPVFDSLWQEWPHTTLRTDGFAVGLPEGQFGNSEVGHTNIGAGRVVMQDLPRITLACRDGSLAKNDALLEFIQKLQKSGGAAHLMGLVSDGGVHAHQEHIAALAGILHAKGLRVFVHVFTDGRDTPPSSAREYVAKLAGGLPPGVRIATIAGRFYAMDRDNRWERVAQAFRAIAQGQGLSFPDADTAVAAEYREGRTDEFITPSVIDGYEGIGPDDGILMANYRSDRVREILQALLLNEFMEFDRGGYIPVSIAAGMADYADYLRPFMFVLFPPLPLTDILGEVVSAAGLSQLRAAETEKYPHVTFFFNGGREAPLPGEHRILAASPKVATYDLQPEMSAVELTDKLLEQLPEQDVVILNFANPDMVGHTGNLAAAIRAVETVDICLGRIWNALLHMGGVLLVTADHGNAEQMFDETTGQPHTAHTTNPVPFILCGYRKAADLRHDGVLADIAPTMLKILNIWQPAAMTGRSLINGTES